MPSARRSVWSDSTKTTSTPIWIGWRTIKPRHRPDRARGSRMLSSGAASAKRPRSTPCPSRAYSITPNLSPCWPLRPNNDRLSKDGPASFGRQSLIVELARASASQMGRGLGQIKSPKSLAPGKIGFALYVRFQWFTVYSTRVLFGCLNTRSCKLLQSLSFTSRKQF
jgi:hypothetical protein